MYLQKLYEKCLIARVLFVNVFDFSPSFLSYSLFSLSRALFTINGFVCSITIRN